MKYNIHKYKQPQHTFMSTIEKHNELLGGLGVVLIFVLFYLFLIIY